MEGVTNNRNYSLDIARILAALGVVMVHCSAPFLMDYQLFSSEFISGSLFDGISRFCVPLFLMISGSLFLDERKEITIKGILLKNVKSIVAITIIWAIVYSVIYNGVFPLLEGKSVNVKSMIFEIMNGHYHMWYLYMIIGIYIITPFLKKFVNKDDKGMVLVFIIISFCFQFIKPVINAMCEAGLNLSIINTWLDKFSLDFFGGYISYFLAGWYIVHVGIRQKWQRIIIYLLGIISLMIAILCVCYIGNYNDVYQYIGAPVFIYSVCVFLALNSIKFKFKEKTAQNVVKLSKLTFGVYLIHVLVISVITALFPYTKYSFLYIVVSFGAVVIISFLISFVLSKIPLLKNLIKA